ncbi:hypothetical protein NDU88_003900 [Pleurodeles waltl]|uniref:Uncharacterized protein n=1 Tax=Pleurodeles waltl TaxID=8319 RepID=A0AAV7QAB7_PLEWA|nr:hypothetical protein NDU88_003900 [Pleurodeles waltl]
MSLCVSGYRERACALPLSVPVDMSLCVSGGHVVVCVRVQAACVCTALICAGTRHCVCPGTARALHKPTVSRSCESNASSSSASANVPRAEERATRIGASNRCHVLGPLWDIINIHDRW